MSRRPQFRFVFLDLAIVLSLVLIGWAAYRLGRIEPETPPQPPTQAETHAGLTEQHQNRSPLDNNGWRSSGEVGSLRAARRALWVAIAVLGVFLVLDLYWRLVIVPLRLKLMEREGQIQHQKKLAHFEELAA